MEEKYLSVKQVAEQINKTEQTVLKRMHDFFPNALKPQGSRDWMIPESDVLAYLGGKPAEKRATPRGDSEGVQDAQDAQKIAEAKEKETEAKVRTKALAAGYDPENPIEAWHKDVEERNQAIIEANADLAKRTEAVEVREQATIEAEQTNSLVAEELAGQRKEADVKVREAEEYVKAVYERARTYLNEFVKEWDKGSQGVLETLLWWCTQNQPPRAYCEFHCGDCIQPDVLENRVTYHYPPPLGLVPCPDCRQDGNGFRDNWLNNLTICDICPTKRIVQEEIRPLIEEIIVAMGGELVREGKGGQIEYIPECFDEEGQYKKGSAFKKKLGVDVRVDNLLNTLWRKAGGVKKEPPELDESTLENETAEPEEITPSPSP